MYIHFGFLLATADCYGLLLSMERTRLSHLCTYLWWSIGQTLSSNQLKKKVMMKEGRRRGRRRGMTESDSKWSRIIVVDSGRSLRWSVVVMASPAPRWCNECSWRNPSYCKINERIIQISRKFAVLLGVTAPVGVFVFIVITATALHFILKAFL